MKRHLLYYLFGGILLGVGLALQQAAHPQLALIKSSPTPSAPAGYVLVARAVDGDTIELADGQKIRYLGMDTPETVDPRKTVQCFGHEASDYNRSLVEGRYVRLARDVEDTDKYGRLLRYVYLPDGTFVNLKLIADGYAHVYTWPPNIAHAREFVAAQATARSAGLGLWSDCPAKK